MNTKGEMDFRSALGYMQLGLRVARSGWNGVNQWICSSEGRHISHDMFWNKHAAAFAKSEFTGEAYVEPYMILKNAQDNIVMGWTPSSGDLFARDWQIVKDKEGELDETVGQVAKPENKAAQRERNSNLHDISELRDIVDNAQNNTDAWRKLLAAVFDRSESDCVIDFPKVFDKPDESPSYNEFPFHKSVMKVSGTARTDVPVPDALIKELREVEKASEVFGENTSVAHIIKLGGEEYKVVEIHDHHITVEQYRDSEDN